VKEVRASVAMVKGPPLSNAGMHMLRTSRSRPCLILAVLALSALACHGQNLPQSAQRGSTILITFSGTFASAPDRVVGYGGIDHSDPQRGTMVLQLGGQGGFELLTRATTTVLAHPAAQQAREEGAFFPFSVDRWIGQPSFPEA
jgi:hypothetical protein